jgi:hypothetical protein
MRGDGTDPKPPTSARCDTSAALVDRHIGSIRLALGDWYSNLMLVIPCVPC